MSQADGLERLTIFLQQTKKQVIPLSRTPLFPSSASLSVSLCQAENAIDCLNIRIKELEALNETTTQQAEKYLEEVDL